MRPSRCSPDISPGPAGPGPRIPAGASLRLPTSPRFEAYAQAVKRQRWYRVLVVDDNLGLLEILKLALGEEHYEVLTASSVAQALAVLKAHAIDLVVLDYCLPDGSGSDVLQITKREWPSLPVIVITGYGSETLCSRLFRLGIRDYFSKPYKVAELLATVRELLNAPSGGWQHVRHAPPSGECALPPPHLHPGIQRAVSWIHTKYAEPIRLKEGAGVAAMSPFHFCRVFKVEVGLSFCQYVMHLRVERAKELLRESQESVTNIAFAVGFLDLSHFYRAFRRSTGHSPCVWRRFARSGTDSNFDIEKPQERPRR